MRRGGRRARVASMLAASAALFTACETVELGPPPADVNACRPSQAFFASEIWPNFLAKDYGGKHCNDSGCHDKATGRALSLVPIPPLDPPPSLPLTGDWADNYKSATENMHCTNVRSSKLLVFPSQLNGIPHGGQKLIEPDGPEADLIQAWVTQ